jgi:hypothetical protein
MQTLLEKLNYKGQERIALIDSDEIFASTLAKDLSGIIIDREIDPRYPYGFIIVFVKSTIDVKRITCIALHNLIADGVLWFCYPKKSSKKYKSDLDRDHGWSILNNSGFHGIRVVSIDEDWSALRFRNAKFIKSTRDKLPG